MTRCGGSTASALALIGDFEDDQYPSTALRGRIRMICELPSGYACARPTVSVVVCTRKRADELRQCLQSIAALTPPADEVIVVDNSSGDPETEYLAELFGARYVLEEVPGLSRARNRALSESRCEVVAYLDDDCLPDPMWLEYLLRPFSDAKVAVVTGEIIRFTDPDQPLPGRHSESGEMRYVTRETPRWFEIATFGGIGTGTNMAFRKQACKDLVLFDERLGRGAPFRIAEENCAFASLLTKGHATVRIPTAVVYHPAKPKDVGQEAKTSIAYWLLLFEKFPENHLDLVRFIMRRALRRPLAWRVDSQNAEGIVSSGWGVKCKALFTGIAMFFLARRYRPLEAEIIPQLRVTVLTRGRDHSPSIVAP